MSDQSFTVRCDQSVIKAMSVINSNGAGLAVVLDEIGKYLGIVTDGDIRRAIIKGYSPQDVIEPIVNRKAEIARQEDSEEQINKRLNSQIVAIPVVSKEREFIRLVRSQSLHIPAAKPGLHGNELRYLNDCVLSNWISSQGSYVDKFEHSFAEFVGTKYALSCSNGTAALHLALLAAGVGTGDEVVVPSFTWISTVNAVRYVGATPIFADINTDTLNIDLENISKVTSTKTKAIIPVHLYGQPADLGPIIDFCRQKEIILIEDAAEAHGATIGHQIVGSFGDMGCFSFFGNKIVTTGEGGMVTTDDLELYEKMKVFRDHGKSKNDPYWHEVVGYNYRMTNMQAAIGLAQMERIEQILEDKYRVACSYKTLLSDAHNLLQPPTNDWSTNVHWLYCLRLNLEKANEEVRQIRDQIVSKLESQSVGARKFFHPVHQMPPYVGYTGSLPVTEKISAGGICLPSYFSMSESEIERVSRSLLRAISLSE